MLNTKIGENYNANDVINSNDLRKRIINVDSRFRQAGSESTTNFVFRPEHPYKNIIRMRVASVEIPNMFYSFTSKNNCFIIKAYDYFDIAREVIIKIDEGNYTSSELIDNIQELLDTQFRDPYGIFITISLNTNTAKVTFTHNGVADYPVTGVNPQPTKSAKAFVLDFVSCLPSSIKNRKQDFGLGYNLGFRCKSYKTTGIIPGSGTTPIDKYCITAEGCLDVVGYTYMFLCVNDLHTVEQKTNENYLQALAKIIIREDKQAVIYDDGASLLSNEIIFPSPVDLKILEVRLVDPYGETVDLCGLTFSFSLEITEVLNTSLYDFYRNYIWFGNIPSVNYKTVRGSPQPLLKGVGPPW
jgi:hypothetical protein